jgi:hypothetical protein
MFSISNLLFLFLIIGAKKIPFCLVEFCFKAGFVYSINQDISHSGPTTLSIP